MGWRRGAATLCLGTEIRRVTLHSSSGDSGGSHGTGGGREATSREMAYHQGSGRASHSYGGHMRWLKGRQRPGGKVEGSGDTLEGAVVCPEHPKLKAGTQMD